MSEPYPFGHVLGRWYYVLVKELSNRGYQVRCLSVSTNQQWAELALKAVEPFGVRLSIHPMSLKRNWLARKWDTFRRPYSYALSNGLVADFVREIRAGYDVIHLEQLWAGYLAEDHPRSLVAVHHLSSLDLKGLNFAGNARFLFDRFLMRHSEEKLLRRLGAITTLSSRLAGSIQSINPTARVFVVPFGIDPSLYDLTAESRMSEPVIGFLANMRWMPGYLAARRLITIVLPLVKQLIPGTQVLIAGWDARKVLAEFVNCPAVTIVENVPAARPLFERLQVLAYPLPQGSGVKVKVLEAMAWGIPIVTTTAGVEGIQAIDGEHCFVTDEDEVFARRVADLLRDSELRRSFTQRARALVEEQHSPGPVIDRLEAVYKVL